MDLPVYSPASFGVSRQSNWAKLTSTSRTLEVDVSSQLARDKKITTSGLSPFMSEAKVQKKNINKNQKPASAQSSSITRLQQCC